MFWDGASIHKSEETRMFAARPDINIELFRNIAYRPDLNPVEKIFRKAKQVYAQELETYKSLNHIWDNEEVVKHIMKYLSDSFVKKEAKKLKSVIDAAKPI